MTASYPPGWGWVQGYTVKVCFFCHLFSCHCVETVLEKHLVLHCPLQWHLWQVAFFAQHCSHLWDPLPHLATTLCVRFSAVGLVGVLLEICTRSTTAFIVSSVIRLLLLSPFKILCCSWTASFCMLAVLTFSNIRLASNYRCSDRELSLMYTTMQLVSYYFFLKCAIIVGVIEVV